jgi:hypothetical protein
VTSPLDLSASIVQRQYDGLPAHASGKAGVEVPIGAWVPSGGVSASTARFAQPLVLLNPLQRMTPSTRLPSSPHDVGAFTWSPIGGRTERSADRSATFPGDGTPDLASSIILRNSPTASNVSLAASAPLHSVIQRSDALETLAPTVSSPVLPVLAAPIPANGLQYSTPSGSPASRDPAGRFGANGEVYVFRKQAPSGTGTSHRTIETTVPPIARIDGIPMVQSVAANVPADESQPAPESDGAGKPGHSTHPANAADLDDLVERVSRRLSRHLAIEHERRGGPTWR